MLNIPGLVGPKLRPKGVGDGHAVNIRQHVCVRQTCPSGSGEMVSFGKSDHHGTTSMSRGGTLSGVCTGFWLYPVAICSRRSEANPGTHSTARMVKRGTRKGESIADGQAVKKIFVDENTNIPYRKPTQVLRSSRPR